MTEKEIATEFLKLAAFGKVDEAYDRFVAPEFKHHNAYFKGDRTTLLEAMKESSKTAPNLSFEIKKIIQEGDQVMAYSHLKKAKMEMAVVHIMKLKNKRIIEMWDVGQQMSADSPNENGMF